MQSFEVSDLVVVDLVMVGAMREVSQEKLQLAIKKVEMHIDQYGETKKVKKAHEALVAADAMLSRLLTIPSMKLMA
jgi:hypothetical protein